MKSPRWLEDLEAKARAASGKDWSLEPGYLDYRISYTYGEDDLGNLVRFFLGERDKGTDSYNIWNHNDAKFIVANSPERILALCQLVRELSIALAMNVSKDTGDPDHNPSTCLQPSCVIGISALDAYQRGPERGKP